MKEISRKIKQCSALLLLGCTALYASFVQPLSVSFDRASFNQYAAQFGNKTANLHELGRIASALNSEQPGIKNRYEVPSFLGISHDEVVQYLVSVPFDETISTLDYIKQEWERFKQQQPRGATALAVDAQRTLENIRKSITRAFSPKHPFFVANEQRKEQLNNFLALTKERKALLMVRSTGREDSKELANAGGNESVSSVLPAIDAISKAMVEVVASYFSEKSIGQRLVAKDKKLFADPFMPVLLQIMIGERSGGSDEIPVSGVMFSQEAEGRTAGVTHIQATYGHNEGVVNGLVPVDTFYIGSSRIVHPVVHVKHSRLVTAADFSKLVLTANPAEMQRKSCLDKDTLFDLQSCAKAIESYYGDPFDIEFVVQGNVIYLVQARPIVWQEIHPSYLKDDFVKNIAEADKQSVYVIGAGGGAVKIINDEQNIIMTDTLRKARDIFLKVDNIDAIQAVIVSEMAPATSHEATTFRGAGKPVVYVPNINIVRSWIIAKQFPLLLDPQRELITIFKPSGEFGTPEDTLVRDAWFAHPIPKKTSLFPEFLAKLSEDEMNTLRPQEFFQGVTTSQLIKMIKNDPADQALKALKSLLARVSSTIKQEEDEQRAKKARREETNPQLIAQLKNVFAHTLSCAKEINQALAIWEQSPKTPRDRLGRLYPITFLEALIKQVPLREIVYDYSFVALIKTERGEEKIIEELALRGKVLRAYIVQYAKASQYALTDELNQTWKKYLKQLITVGDIDLQQDFARLMLNLSNLDLVPLWLNISFAQAEKEHKGDAVKTVNALVDEYQQSEAFLNQLHQKKQQLEALNMANWEEPDKFKKQWESFQKILVYFISQEFISSLEQAQTLEKNGALTVMQLFVSVFDTAIKTLEGSGMYTDVSVKATNFNTMVNDYLVLLWEWAVMPSLSTIMQTLLDDWTFKTLDKYLDAIYKIIDRAPKDISQLRPSSRFNVSAAALGSKALWKRSTGEESGNKPTLEDMFTLVHQNLLVVLATLSKQVGIETIAVPPLVESLKKEVEWLTIQLRADKTSSASLIGMSFSDNKLTYYYNLPIIHHSNTFQVIYNMQTKTVDFAVQFLGDPLGRWRLFAEAAYLMSRLAKLSFVEQPEVDEQRGSMSFAWRIEPTTNIPLIVNYIKVLAQWATPYWDKAYGGKNILEVIADMSNITTDNLIDIIFNTITQRHHLIVFLPKVIGYKDDIDDPAVKKSFALLKEIAQVGSQEIKKELLSLIEARVDAPVLRSIMRYDETIDILRSILLDPEREKYIKTISFISKKLALFSKEKSQMDALSNFAQELVNHSDKNIRLIAVNLLGNIGSWEYRRHVFEQSKTTAKTAINDPELAIRKTALEIFQQLVEKGQEFDAALMAARKAIEEKDVDMHKVAIKVFTSLVQKGQALQEAEKVAFEAINHENVEVREEAIKLLTSLVKKDRVHLQALETALKVIHQEEIREGITAIWRAIKLLENLLVVQNIEVTAEQASNIIEASTYLLQKGLRYHKDTTLELFEKLAQEGKYLDIIIGALNRSAQSLYADQVESILDHLKRHGKEKEAKNIEQKLLPKIRI